MGGPSHEWTTKSRFTALFGTFDNRQERSGPGALVAPLQDHQLIGGRGIVVHADLVSPPLDELESGNAWNDGFDSRLVLRREDHPMIATPADQSRDETDPALRNPLTEEEPGSQAVEPSPDDDEENLVVTDQVEEIEVDDGDEDDEAEEPPDQKDVAPGSDAASDDDALGVGKDDEPDSSPT
jgi:hypothetical protein